MSMSPKYLLRNIKRGIGAPARHPVDAEIEVVNFDDSNAVKCRLECDDAHLTFVVGPDAAVLVLDRGQVQRLINTLERWAHAGTFGSTDEGKAG